MLALTIYNMQLIVDSLEIETCYRSLNLTPGVSIKVCTCASIHLSILWYSPLPTPHQPPTGQMVDGYCENIQQIFKLLMC